MINPFGRGAPNFPKQISPIKKTITEKLKSYLPPSPKKKIQKNSDYFKNSNQNSFSGQKKKKFSNHLSKLLFLRPKQCL